MKWIFVFLLAANTCAAASGVIGAVTNTALPGQMLVKTSDETSAYVWPPDTNALANALLQVIASISNAIITVSNDVVSYAQPLDPDLSAVSDLSTTSFGRSLLEGANAAGVRSTIGAGTASVKADVGLGSVDNTADSAKPISTAQQTALDLKANIASPTFTGTPALPSGTTFATDLTAVPANTGGWTVYKVAGSDATTTGQSLVDITGLVSGTLQNATLYEVEIILRVSTTAVTTGCRYAIFGGGTGAAATLNVIVTGTTTLAAAGNETINTIATQTATAYLTTSASSGTIIMRGFVTTRSTGTATVSVQHLKVTSGTSTVRIGSILRIRKA